MAVTSPYEVLSLDPDADEEAIERAYRRQVKETHPDHGGSPRAFQQVRAAYEALTNGEADGDGAADDDSATTEEYRVEFLNDAVLDDHGWNLEDDDLFEKAAAAGLDPADYGRFLVTAEASLLEAAEHCGFAWPFACRGGACANCAVAVTAGELSMPVDHILPREMMDRGIRLSCIGTPATNDLRVVYNVKHRPELEDLRLPADRFERSRRDG